MNVFCDHLTCSMPLADWEEFRQEAAPLFDMIGAQVDYDSERQVQWRAGKGTCRATRVNSVWVISATGAFLAGLRCLRIFSQYLATIASHPHRVTRLDASLDLKHDTPQVLAKLVQQASSSEGLHVTRKRIKPQDCTRYVTQRADGLDTGSVYLGPVNADVRPVVYDKRKEQLDAGMQDLGPLTRYECRIRSGVGPSLRDAAEPTSIFWHFMGEVLDKPADAPEWTPHGLGFDVLRSPPALPAARLLRRLDASEDLRDLLRLAREVGPYGLSLMQGQIAKLYEGAERGAGVPPAVTALDLAASDASSLVAAELAESAQLDHAPR